MSTLQDIFTTGINAARDVLVARSSNDPLPNSRGANDVTAPAGSPATNGIAGMKISTGMLLLVAAVGVVIYLIARR